MGVEDQELIEAALLAVEVVEEADSRNVPVQGLSEQAGRVGQGFDLLPADSRRGDRITVGLDEFIDQAG